MTLIMLVARIRRPHKAQYQWEERGAAVFAISAVSRRETESRRAPVAPDRSETS